MTTQYRRSRERENKPAKTRPRNSRLRLFSNPRQLRDEAEADLTLSCAPTVVSKHRLHH